MVFTPCKNFSICSIVNLVSFALRSAKVEPSRFASAINIESGSISRTSCTSGTRIPVADMA